jgi:tRNA nucleotidyltransferase/poly(A) polymerase
MCTMNPTERFDNADRQNSSSVCYNLLMTQGGLTHYANRTLPPGKRLSLFVDGEKRLTWTSLFLDDHPHAHLYLVGGTVRDTLLGHTPDDIDLVITNVPAEQLERWLARHGAVSFAGKRFGTFKFTPHGCRKQTPIDIALPRTEAVSTGHNSGRSDLAITSDHRISIGEDLSRRDLTINAIAYDLRTGDVADPFFGLQDLDTQTIRTVLNSDQRFHEDATRMLRAMRFASRLHFAIEGHTWDAIVRNIKLLNNTTLADDGTYRFVIPREMIGKEFLLSFYYHPVHTIELWQQSGALALLMPNVALLCTTVEADGTPTIEKLKQLLHLLKNRELLASHHLKNVSGSTLVAALGLLQDHPETLSKQCTGLHFHQFPDHHVANVDCKQVAWMIDHRHFLEEQDPASLRPSQFERIFCRQRGKELLTLLHALAIVQGTHGIARERIHIATRIAEQYKTLKTTKLISGHDLIEHGIEPGPRIRQYLDLVRDAQLTGQIHTKEDALQLIQTK